MVITHLGGKVARYLAAGALLLAFLVGCVQPVEPTPIPTPTTAPTPTPPPSVGPTFPVDAISTWLSGFGVTANNISLFTQLQAGPDDIVGYLFQDASGRPCVGFVLTTAATAQIWNGDYRCLTAGLPAVAAPLLFALTNNEFYVATYGYVDPVLLPTANAFAIVYQDGVNEGDLLTNYAFLRLRSGVQFPTQVVIIDAGGNTLATPPVQ